MKNVKMIQFIDHGGEVGHLTAIEAQKDIPFVINRIYYITGVPGDVTRGFHSHRHLEQVLVCVSGSVKIRVKTPFEEQIVLLDSPEKGLFIGNMIWREMFDFSEHAVLLVLASEYYAETDYIRDYQTYREEYNNRYNIWRKKE